MRYQLKPGIVCTDLCGNYLLIAAKEAAGSLPYIQEINDQAYYCCKMMEKAVSLEEMETEITAYYGISSKEAGQGLRVFLTQLETAGYIAVID